MQMKKFLNLQICTLAHFHIDIMNILEEIIANKFREVEESKMCTSLKVLEKRNLFKREIVSLKKALLDKDSTGIIAEFKRKSPSKGVINESANVELVTSGYIKAGASALSILTDEKYFGGSNEYLIRARKINSCPILRKEFIVDEYQIIEAKSIGADAILLIAACLSKEKISKFSKLAKSLGLEILFEINGKKELDKIVPEIEIVGINNRDLKDFVVNTDVSIEIASLLPDNYVKVAESGINSVVMFQKLKSKGFKGFLMGEYFMKATQPEIECANFIKQLK
jgi:indole-3-glycerol phosphate synthase